MEAMKAGYNLRNLWKINTPKSLPFVKKKKKKKEINQIVLLIWFDSINICENHMKWLFFYCDSSSVLEAL